jgi:YYY domain-containing protein
MNTDENKKNSTFTKIIISILFLIIIGISVFFRVRGLYWGEYLYLHPDERFLVWVGSSIESVGKLGDYFNTHISSLNPHNRGHGFFVYGDFPVILTRYISETLFEFVGWNEITQVGRALSSLFDLGSVILIFFIGKRLFGNWVGLLAASFSGMAVLQIQQSHFFTVDTFATFFTTLAVYIVVSIASHNFPVYKKIDDQISASEVDLVEIKEKERFRIPSQKTLILSIIFGVVVGLAAASKINTVTIAFLLPIAFFVLWDKFPTQDSSQKLELILRDLIIGGIFALISFRIFQPFAFEGPGFFGIQLNTLWLNNLREVSAQSGGKVDFPPALQWARRDFFFSARNLSLWGLGLPLSIVAWLGVFTMGWRILRGEWKKYLLIWLWTMGYFLWQSSLGNSVMRYQMPVYPMFGLMAAWMIHFLFTYQPDKLIWIKPLRLLGGVFTIVSITGTFIWAFMFSSIYVEPITRIEASKWIYENVPGPINLMLRQEEKLKQEIVSFPYGFLLSAGSPYVSTFTIDKNGMLEEIRLARVIQQENIEQNNERLAISIIDIEDSEKLLGSIELSGPFDYHSSGINKNISVKFDPPINLESNHRYKIVVENKGQGLITLLGSAPANESSWDDGLPMRADGKDGYGGIYQRDLTFEMYWEDNQDKLDRFISTLYRSDYIFISSNRQWGTTTRVPERYPLTTRFYQALLGCPNEDDIYRCYSRAKPGMYQGDLGFELIKVFESYPKIGNFEINDQFADEAFTVYDHPKVLIFKKTENYDTIQVSQILSDIDLDKVLYFTPGEFPDYPADLELPEKRLVTQQSGGTWSEIFDTTRLINQHPFLAVILWYFAITLLGWAIYPIVRLGFSGLIDKGYPFSKLLSMLIISLLVWLGGSFSISVTRGFIWVVIGIVLFVSLLLGFFSRSKIKEEIQKNYNLYISIELISLVLFLGFLLIRLGNPDLWHPGKGGEKPMDFSYLNAVIKSTTFPPYDPWYSGGYINYYYYGFVIVGVIIKWLGIVPAIAYNIVLPTLFAFVGLGAFSIVWNLVTFYQRENDTFFEIPKTIKSILKSSAAKAGLCGVFLTLIMGNLGSVRMIWHGLQKIGSPTGMIDGAKFFERWVWTFKGLFEFFRGQNLPFYPGDWYWVPSRALPQEPITEFPFFTFIYADLHAHMIAMPLTIMAIAWALSILLSRWKFDNNLPGWLTKTILLTIGAITIGSLRPTNTWDFPTYLIFGVVILAYTILRFGKGFRTAYHISELSGRLLEVLLILVTFVFATFLFFSPFYNWYGQAYTQIQPWMGSHSPFWSYFTHWGLFLFIIAGWLVTETIQWMENTRLSSTRKLLKHQFWIWLGLAFTLALTITLMVKEIVIAGMVIPMAIWAGILIFRKNQSDAKRFVLFLTGTALILTLMVELIVLKGDIGRMNTVFKFYLQAWILFAISSGAALIWFFSEFNLRSSRQLKNQWQIVFVVLMASAALYPLVATAEKIDDRMSAAAPNSLDGMVYMQSSTYYDEGVNMNLDEDYQAIRWIQENVSGSPVIVEANTVEYRWGSRYSIYTGLPGVVGWNWHQRQQRAVVPSTWITNRVEEVNNFYLSNNIIETKEFLAKYNVSYIVVGQLEKAKYIGEGIGKFSQLDGSLWRSIFTVGNTTIYQVIQ